MAPSTAEPPVSEHPRSSLSGHLMGGGHMRQVRPQGDKIFILNQG